MTKAHASIRRRRDHALAKSELQGIHDDAIREACDPIGRWWQDAQETGRPDPEQLQRSVRRARLLGPLPGPLGEALAYILDGCPDLDYARVHAAFSRVLAVGSAGPTDEDLGEEAGAQGRLPLQLRFASMTAPAARATARVRSRP